MKRTSLLALPLFAALSAASIASAEDLTVEVAAPESTQAAQSGNPKPISIQDYLDFATGLGYRNKGGSFPSQGGFATFRAHGYQTQENDQPLMFGDGTVDFNVFNKEKGTDRLSTDLHANANVFVGYSFNKNQDGTDFLIGGSARIDGTAYAYSQSERGQISGFVGPETGIHAQYGQVVGTLTASVGVGGEQCNVSVPGGDVTFNTNAVGFAGIGRLLVSDRFYMNVFYVNFPKSKAGDHGVTQQGGERASGTLFWNIGEKLTVTGNCTFSTLTQQVTQTNSSGAVTGIIDNQYKGNQWSIGIIRRFGK